MDKEERPDIDSIYMAACQALTGRYGMLGLRELLLAVRDTWETNREELLQSSEEITNFLNQKESSDGAIPSGNTRF